MGSFCAGNGMIWNLKRTDKQKASGGEETFFSQPGVFYDEIVYCSISEDKREVTSSSE